MDIDKPTQHNPKYSFIVALLVEYVNAGKEGYILERKFGFGLDMGIGSCGFAVLSWTEFDKSDARIEYLGVRLFDSGEEIREKKRKNQDRRSYRSARRLLRRCKHRKERAKRFLQKIGLIKYEQIKKWQEENGDQNIFAIRFKGLSERLTPEEIADCIIHICNHRGYKEFYDEIDNDGRIKQGLDEFEKLYRKGKYISVADMILHDDIFKTNTAFPDYKNHLNKERYILIKRIYLQQELLDILHKQQEYYQVQLSEDNIKFLVEKIVFSQRDFETGPGKEYDETRRFKGFLDSLGKCTFYKDENRAFRSTVIADIYSLINTLSQFTYIEKNSGNIILKPEAASEIVDFALRNGAITEADVKKILKKYDLEMVKNGKLDKKLPDTVKTLKILKDNLLKCDYSYEDLISEEQFDIENLSKLHQLCICLSKNITPRRRRRALALLGWNKKVQDVFVRQKFGGTASVCERYMLEAITAFCKGEVYGNFQARRFREQSIQDNSISKYKFLPPITKRLDEDLIKNIVVFKSVNEMRKVLNALIRKYGSPEYINVEVASDLGRSFVERNRIDNEQKKFNKQKEEIKNKLIELGLRKDGEVKASDILRYRLWKEQEGIDLYTGLQIPENEVLSLNYDIDHIVPFSLILDDTINNKALVNLGVNRAQKAQKLPLEYLRDEKRKMFLQNCNRLFKAKKISSKKYQYLMMESLYEEKAQVILAEWKSRNINDTRYITRYIVNYLTNNLMFTGNKKKHVYGVKGALTSKLRKIWLNKATWGSDEKNRGNNLHHAADAVVIANMTPACIELASDTMKLQNIFRNNHRRINNEYMEYLDKAKCKMQKYYGLSYEYTEQMLTKFNRIPSLVRNLQDEVDIRLTDEDAEGYIEGCEETFMERAKDFYFNDQEFAAKIHLPLVSYKQEKKFQGEITDSNAVKKENIKSSSIVKVDRFGNESVLSANKYYCIEIYKDINNFTKLRGIRYVDLVKKNKKIWLQSPYPEDYKKHVMYIFNNDYIKVFDRNSKMKFSGYYKSIKNINENRIYIKCDNDNNSQYKTIGKLDFLVKYNISILGEVGGEVKCSEPFMLLQEKV